MAGFLLFSTRPLAYAGNAAFLVTFGLVGAVLLNIALLHGSGAWRRAVAAGTVPVALLAGRWVWFLQ